VKNYNSKKPDSSGHPFISVCIPSYKRLNYLQRLLDSIVTQTYRNVEVIVSDDSNDDSVENLITAYSGKLLIRYYKNNPAKGTPANWNAAIARAEGEWIKLMHDDDWFASNDSLSGFADCTANQQKIICSGYTSHFEETGKMPQQHILSAAQQRKITHNPGRLLMQNFIGPPSVCMVHKSVMEKYDERLKWRVDCDYYAKILGAEKSFEYIRKPLINIGVSDSQVTNSCINNPAVELPEALILLETHGDTSLENIAVYDAWWRLLRNMHISTEKQLNMYTVRKWPQVVYALLRDLNSAPRAIYSSGWASKFFMTLSFLRNRKLVKKN
jgi:glycosyltransferase involved in cell wall biosynthesis